MLREYTKCTKSTCGRHTIRETTTVRLSLFMREIPSFFTVSRVEEYTLDSESVSEDRLPVLRSPWITHWLGVDRLALPFIDSPDFLFMVSSQLSTLQELRFWFHQQQVGHISCWGFPFLFASTLLMCRHKLNQTWRNCSWLDFVLYCFDYSPVCLFCLFLVITCTFTETSGSWYPVITCV